MDEAELADLLYGAAEGRAKRHGVRFGDGADQQLHELARDGAHKMLAADPSAPPDKIREATEAFERLVDAMVAAASEIPGYIDSRPGFIGEQTLSGAMSRLCPLFPIC